MAESLTSAIRMRSGTEYVVKGTPTETVQKLLGKSGSADAAVGLLWFQLVKPDGVKVWVRPEHIEAVLSA